LCGSFRRPPRVTALDRTVGAWLDRNTVKID
jgi:hypothetical protein